MEKSIKNWIMNQITITANTISYNHQIIKTSNISSVDLKTIAKGNSMALIYAGIFCAIGVIVMWAQRSGKSPFEIFGSVAFFAALSFLCFWGNERQKKKSRQYVLYIQTNAGKVQLFGHKDYPFVNTIRKRIMEVLNNTGSNLNYTFNIDNKTVINNPTGPVNISNVAYYSGMSPSDKAFLSGQFESALQRIQKDLSTRNDRKLSTAFESMKQELQSSKPRKNVLASAWDILGNVGSLAELASTIERAINLF